MTPQDSGADVIEARTGEVLVRLRETPTSGYRWQPAAMPEGVTLVGDSFTPEPSAAPVAGGSGERVFRLRVPAPGQYDVRFELKRAWESTAAEVRRVRLVVTPSG